MLRWVPTVSTHLRSQQSFVRWGVQVASKKRPQTASPRHSTRSRHRTPPSPPPTLSLPHTHAHARAASASGKALQERLPPPMPRRLRAEGFPRTSSIARARAHTHVVANSSHWAARTEEKRVAVVPQRYSKGTLGVLRDLALGVLRDLDRRWSKRPTTWRSGHTAICGSA